MQPRLKSSRPLATSDVDDPSYLLFQQRFGALRRARQAETILIFVVVILLFVVSAAWTDFLPSTDASRHPAHRRVFRQAVLHPAQRSGADPVAVLALPHLFGGVKQPQSIAYWFYRIDVYAALLWQTVQMAILATVIGFAPAFALSFPAAQTLTANRVVVFVCSPPAGIHARRSRRSCWPSFWSGRSASARWRASWRSPSIPPAHWENCSPNSTKTPTSARSRQSKPWAAVLARADALRRRAQMLPGFLSYGLLRFEINVRSSTIIGFVGAGGIGQELKRVIGFNIYEEVSAICILILLIVVAIDLLSEQVRHRLIGAMAGAAS